MSLIRKIKSYFIKYEFSSWKDFDRNNYDLKFSMMDDEILLDIGSYIKNNLKESRQIGNKRHRLKDTSAIECRSLDELLPVIRDIIKKDYRETSVESILHKWDFQYFLSEHSQCENTICISNALTATASQNGNCVYPLASVRKYNNSYYCWNHLG